jgi:hypothetical protein
MRDRADILPAANGCQKQRGILLELRHKNLPGLVDRKRISKKS